MVTFKVTEADVEEYLYKNPEMVKGIKYWIGRQVSIPTGRIDLLGIGGRSSIFVVELKVEPLSIDHLLQLSRYLNCTKRILREFVFDWFLHLLKFGNRRGGSPPYEAEKKINSFLVEEYYHSVKGILIGPGDISSDFLHAADVMDIKILSLYFDIDRGVTVGTGWDWKADFLSNFSNHDNQLWLDTYIDYIALGEELFEKHHQTRTNTSS